MFGNRRRVAATMLLWAAAPATAQLAPPHVQTTAEALAQDAAAYAALHPVPLDEAERRLLAQEESVATTDRIARTYAARLAGVAIEHEPAYRIVVLLTGDDPVPDEVVAAGGLAVPVHYATGARATRDEIVRAIERNQATIRAMLAHPPGLGLDQRTGELVVTLNGSDVSPYRDEAALRDRLAELTGVPVSLRLLDGVDANAASVEGGARVVGLNPADGRRYACTTGFTVTDGARDGVVTAAHCPDELSLVAPGEPPAPLSFAGQWGWGYQDVQLHLADRPLEPLFYADTPKTQARAVERARPRASTRAGDMVCHRGERTGYSCAEVALTDFAPAGDLCGGACLPTWVAVKGPTCRSGDSGAPVFLGDTAFGLVKGGTYAPDRRCLFYYYMSTDYLPEGWRLLQAADRLPASRQPTATIPPAAAPQPSRNAPAPSAPLNAGGAGAPG